MGSTAEVDVVGDNVAGLVRVTENDGLLGADKAGGLDEDLCAETGVDGRVDEVLVEVVVDMGGAEADGRAAGVDVGPAVVGVGDGQVAGVLARVGVGVSDERALPVVVEEGVGEGDPVGGVGDIEEAVVVVLADVQVALEVDVVDPDVGGLVDANGVTVVGVDAGNGEVADNNVGDATNVQADTLEGGAAGAAHNGLIGGRPDAAGAGEAALEDDNGRAVSLGGLAEGGKIADGGGGAPRSAGGAAVGGGEADVAGLGDGGALLDGALILLLVDGWGGAGDGEAGHEGEMLVLHGERDWGLENVCSLVGCSKSI